MKLPLYAKLSLALLLNLVLAAALLMFYPGRATPGADLLLSAPVRDRLVTIAQDLATALAQPEANAQEVLKQYRRQYGVDFSIALPDEGMPPPPPEMRPPPPAPGRNAGKPPRMRPGGAPQPQGPPPMRERSQRAGFITLRHEGGRGWVLKIPATWNDGTPQARGREVTAVTDNVGRLVAFLGIAEGARLLLALIVVSALIWVPLAAGITRSLMRITQTTGRIAEGRFDARADETRGDEIGTLATSINQMARKLESFVGRQRSFMADMAHEVTAPLARMRMGLGLLEAQLDDRQKALLADVEEDAEQMSQMLEELLLFSRAGLESGHGDLEGLYLSDIVAKAVEQEDATQRTRLDVSPALQVKGYRALMTRAVSNLVRNALRYAPPESGPVELVAARYGSTVHLSVRDRGPGVPPEVLAHLGEPFYRPEIARSRDTGGFGLGLAIVRRCIESCGGSVTFSNRAEGGFEARIVLPSAPSPGS